MNNEQEAVSAEEPSASPEPEVQEQVNNEPEVAAPETPAIQEPTVQTPQQPDDSVDERGVPWKNVAMEAQRKFNELPQVIRQTVEETLKTQAPQQQQKPEYTIEQLEQFKMERPDMAPWVESQKAQIIQKNLEKTFEARVLETEKRGQEAQTRQQSEQWVVNHPKFKDCFTKDPYSGQTVWNLSNPLSRIMGNYLNQQDPVTGKLVKDRADGMIVAAKMAYADYALMAEPTANVKVNQLKKDLRKAQKVQMVQAGGVTPTAPVKSNVKKALDNYNKTYKKQDIQAATKSYLLQAGLIQEE